MKINTGYMSKIKTNLENRNCMYTHNIKFLNNIINMKNVEKGNIHNKKDFRQI